ncbi:MAG: 3-mercaptopyruvate sulfurtransferase [Alphaproteobacteria bacterium]
MTYANPDALIETGWLASHLNDPHVKILDASYHLPGTGRDAETEFTQRHIPGAMLFDIEDVRDRDNPFPHMLPDAGQFGAQMETLGLSNDDLIVIYDVHGVRTSPRAWWTFRVFGHENVAILNGGLPKWLNEQLPVTDDIADPPRGTFRATLNPALVRDIDQMLANQETRRELVVDARPAGRFVGTVPEPREGLRGGHMPGSVSLPVENFIDESTKTFLPADGIKAALENQRIDYRKPVVATCGSGVAACLISLGMYLIGNETVPVYDGSWSEWGARDDTPVE